MGRTSLSSGVRLIPDGFSDPGYNEKVGAREQGVADGSSLCVSRSRCTRSPPFCRIILFTYPDLHLGFFAREYPHAGWLCPGNQHSSRADASCKPACLRACVLALSTLFS